MGDVWKKFIGYWQRRALEPTIAWGLRMGLALVVPLIWGALTGHLHEAEWIALTAEAICWVELKGTVGQRMRVVFGGIFLTLAFALVGALTAKSLLLSLLAMLVVGFLSAQFKNLGDRGAGLSICVYVMFIIGNAAPAKSTALLWERCTYILAGGGWALVLALLSTAILRQHQPYRRSVAAIWQAVSNLTAAVGKGWDGKGPRSSVRAVYGQEQAVRAAIDASLAFHESSVDQINDRTSPEYGLAQIRRTTALVATHIVAISEILESVSQRHTAASLRSNIYGLLRTLGAVSVRMADLLQNPTGEGELLLRARIDRVRVLSGITAAEAAKDTTDGPQIARALQLTERSLKLVESAYAQLQKTTAGERRYFRSYSVFKIAYLLNPRHWVGPVRLIFQLNRDTTRYAIRIAVAATLALGIAKYLRIDHGYWIPFTVILVSQPYFAATLKKALDRVVGTVLGGVAGGLFLKLEVSVTFKIALLFICAVGMVYYLRRTYATAAFFITLSLVVLFAVEDDASNALILTRALSTVGGALLAVFAGFVLLPTWDRNALPHFIAQAFGQNLEYLRASFFDGGSALPWTRLKRAAERANGAAFESLQRYLDEPGTTQREYIRPFQLVMHNVRMTRELNAIHLDWEIADAGADLLPAEKQEKVFNDIQQSANALLERIQADDELQNCTPLTRSFAEKKTLSRAQANLLLRLNTELQAYREHLAELDA